MRAWTFASLCGLLLWLATAPAQATDIAADARWYVQLQVQQMLDSEIGQAVRQAHDLGPDSPRAARFERFAGFNPLRDVHSVLMYHHSFEEGEAVVVLRGQFDPRRIEQRVAEAPRHERIDVAGLAGHRFEMPTRRGPRVVDAVVRRQWIALSADRAALEQAVQVLTGERGGLDEQAELLAPRRREMWLHGGAIELHRARAHHSEIAAAARRLHLSLGESGGRLLWYAEVAAVDARRAALMVEAAEGLQAMALLRHEPDSPLARAIAALRIDREDQRVRLRWSQPVQAVVELIPALPGRH